MYKKKIISSLRKESKRKSKRKRDPHRKMKHSEVFPLRRHTPPRRSLFIERETVYGTIPSDRLSSCRPGHATVPTLLKAETPSDLPGSRSRASWVSRAPKGRTHLQTSTLLKLIFSCFPLGQRNRCQYHRSLNVWLIKGTVIECYVLVARRCLPSYGTYLMRCCRQRMLFYR